MLRGDWPFILQVIERFDLLEIQGILLINPAVSRYFTREQSVALTD